MRPDSINRRPAASRLLVACVALMVCVPLVAQVFLPARRVVPSVDAYYNPTNWLLPPEYWWNATDLASSPVETWTDRVKGRNLKQTTADLKPFWSTNGVYFDGVADYFVATNILAVDMPGGSSLGSWLFVLGPRQPSRAVQQLIIGNQPSGGDVTLIVQTNWFGDGNGAVGDEIGPITTDYIALFLQTSNLSSTVYGFTNGILARAASPWASSANILRVGNTSVADGFGNFWPYEGYIQEIIGWTNAAFTEAALSNLNKYVTSVWTIGTAAPDPSPYPAQAAEFDGTTDYMRLTSSGPTGLSDGKVFTVSCWLDFSGGDGVQKYIFTTSSTTEGKWYLYKTTGNNVALFARNAAGGTILDIVGSTSITAASGWVHVYACVDLTDTAKRKIYVNGVAESLTVNTYSNDTIDFTGVNYTYTAGSDGGSPVTVFLPASVSEFWWNDSYLDDVSQFASGGCPIYLGGSGEIPTGSSPVFYLRGSGSGFNVNAGTGGNFTTTGTLTAPTPPCQ